MCIIITTNYYNIIILKFTKIVEVLVTQNHHTVDWLGSTIVGIMNKDNKENYNRPCETIRNIKVHLWEHSKRMNWATNYNICKNTRLALSVIRPISWWGKTKHAQDWIVQSCRGWSIFSIKLADGYMESEKGHRMDWNWLMLNWSQKRGKP